MQTSARVRVRYIYVCMCIYIYINMYTRNTNMYAHIISMSLSVSLCMFLHSTYSHFWLVVCGPLSLVLQEPVGVSAFSTRRLAAVDRVGSGKGPTTGVRCTRLCSIQFNCTILNCRLPTFNWFRGATRFPSFRCYARRWFSKALLASTEMFAASAPLRLQASCVY